jgi:hypothetical protein
MLFTGGRNTVAAALLLILVGFAVMQLGGGISSMRDKGKLSAGGTATADAVFDRASDMTSPLTARATPLSTVRDDVEGPITPESEAQRSGAGRRSASAFRAPREYYPGEYGWVFKRYIPSKLETEFLEAVRPFERSVSFRPLIPRFQSETRKYLSYNERFARDAVVGGDHLPMECRQYAASARQTASVDPSVAAGTCLGSLDPFDADVFSRFEYEFVCLHPPCDAADLPPGRSVGEIHTSYIEPLYGYLRHQQMFLQDGIADWGIVVNKQYMVLDKWALHHLYTRWKRPDRRTHFYDMGASTYLDGPGGASQVWFVGVSECLCVPFTEMRFWEAGPIDPAGLWGPVPQNIFPHYIFYNYPLSTSRDSWHNPLNHLRKRVPRDSSEPVIMKVDFDSPEVERTIVETLLERPELYSLVDELFFEDHVILGNMVNIWGPMSRTMNLTIVDSILLFQRLRHRGIRAHSWV